MHYIYMQKTQNVHTFGVDFVNFLYSSSIIYVHWILDGLCILQQIPWRGDQLPRHCSTLTHLWHVILLVLAYAVCRSLHFIVCGLNKSIVFYSCSHAACDKRHMLPWRQCALCVDRAMDLYRTDIRQKPCTSSHSSCKLQGMFGEE